MTSSTPSPQSEATSSKLIQSFAAASTADAGRSSGSRTGLWSASFFGLAAVQFLTAFNDITYRWLVVSIGYEKLGASQEGFVLSIGLACFVLPYLLLAAPAGYLADRFRKRRVIAACMVSQAVIVIFGVGAILFSNAALIFLTLGLMGVQGALLGPSKDGSIPETVRLDRIAAANGVMGMVAVSAAVVGSMAGNVLYELTRPLGQQRWWISASVCMGAAILGWLFSFLILPRQAADPARMPPKRIIRQTMHYMVYLRSRPGLIWAALAVAYFWFLASLAQLNVYLFGTTRLHLNQAYVGSLLALLALGLAIGSLAAGGWSGAKIKLGIVPFGATGIALSGILIATIEGGAHSYLMTCLCLFAMGFSAGIYVVPVQSFLQYHSPPQTLGVILAATNFLAFGAMLVSSALFWLLRSVVQVSAGTIFLIAGIITIPILVAALRTWGRTS